jgi:uncharacterized protein
MEHSDAPGAVIPIDGGEPAAGRGRRTETTLGRVAEVAGSDLVIELAPAGPPCRAGALVTVAEEGSTGIGIVTALRNSGERRTATAQLMGELVTGADGLRGFRRGIAAAPVLDAPVKLAAAEVLAEVFRRPQQATARIGSVVQDPRLPAYVLTDNLLGKHVAVLGTTGAGKSCAVTVLLRSILDDNPAGHIVLLDPHAEYARAFDDRAELLDTSSLQLPYWLLTFEEIAHVLVNRASAERAYAESAILREAIVEARRRFHGDEDAEHLTVDTPVPYRLSDLRQIVSDGMGALNKADSTAPYLHLIARLDSVRNDRRFDFMFSSFAVRDNLRQVLSRILRIPVDGRPITIVDISGVPSEIVDVVVSVLVRLVFELKVWSERGAAPPVLLVCEEAHRYIPNDPAAGFAPTKRAIDRIAKEGRKYGISLCLVSQRPSELSTSSLSQCNTVFALRMSNEHDQAFVRRTLPESARWLLDRLPSLNNREAVVVGDGVTVPMHVRFDELAAEHRPASGTAPFASAWQEEVDESFLEATIDRWRHQRR